MYFLENVELCSARRKREGSIRQDHRGVLEDISQSISVWYLSLKVRSRCDELLNLQLRRSEYQILHPIFGLTDKDRADSLRFDQDRLWTKATEDPASHWIYVQDTSNGEILGACEWLIQGQNPFPKGLMRVEATW